MHCLATEQRYDSIDTVQVQVRSNKSKRIDLASTQSRHRTEATNRRIGTKAASEKKKPRNSVEIEIKIETNAASESREASRRIGTNAASETKPFRLIRGYDTIHVQEVLSSTGVSFINPFCFIVQYGTSKQRHGPSRQERKEVVSMEGT